MPIPGALGMQDEKHLHSVFASQALSSSQHSWRVQLRHMLSLFCGAQISPVAPPPLDVLLWLVVLVSLPPSPPLPEELFCPPALVPLLLLVPDTSVPQARNKAVIEARNAPICKTRDLAIATRLCSSMSES
jgi:hypothetical protein